MRQEITEASRYLCTAYKIYAEILRNRLEEKELVLENQAGFRKGRSAIDNIFVLCHMIQKKKEQEGKKEKIYALFADLKTAFNNVDRNTL